jgi:uncharacterized membrane protein
MMGGYGMMGGMNWFGMFLMGSLCFIVIALVVWGLISLLRTQQPAAEPDARELLRRRYARGEISHNEFEQARLALQEKIS